MPEGGEGSKPDLRGAKFREGIRNSRLGEILHVRRSPRATAATGGIVGNEDVKPPETPASPSDGRGRNEPPATPSGSPEPDNNAENTFSAQDLMDKITRPEFKAILRSDLPPKEAYVSINNQYVEAYQDLMRRIGEVDPGLESDQERQRLSAEIKQLKAEYDIAREFFAVGAASPSERGLGEELSDELGEIEALAEDDETKHERIREFMDDLIKVASPEDEPLPDRVLKLIAQDDAATERFLSRLIVSELENEPWQIKGFYGNINFEKFIRVSRDDIKGPRRERLLALIDANGAFHNMNYILRRNFDQFAQQSEAILPKHLAVLSSVPGVAEGLALYEEYYTAVRARETLITDKTAAQIDRDVEQALKDQALPKGSSGETSLKGITGGPMEDWEILRAYIYARNFYRITIRAGEQVALSELAKDSALFTTPAHGKVAQVLNTLKFVGFRFRPEEPLGGPELLDNALKNNTEKRRKRGVRVKILQGTDVDMREFQNIIAARGVFATWRNAEIAFPGLRFIDESAGGKITTVQEFFTDHKQEIEGLRDKEKKLEKKKKNGKVTPEEEIRLRADTELLFKPLLDNGTINLGLLVSPSYLQMPTSLKEMLWERVADLNPLVMASLLTRLEMDKEMDNIPSVQALEDILINIWGSNAERKAILGAHAAYGPTPAETVKFEAQTNMENNIEELRKRLNNKLATSESMRSDEDREEIASIRLAIEGRSKDLLRIRYGKQAEDMGIRELREEIETLASLPEAKRKKDIDLQIRLDAMTMELKGKEVILGQVLQGEDWQKLSLKLRTAHRLRMNYEEKRLGERQPDEDETEEQFRARLQSSPKTVESFLTGELELNEAEKNVLNAITENGKKITGDLARIKQSYAWFMDDVPFKSLDWMSLGQFYDRQTNDLASFNKAAGALLKIISNPFGVSPEDILKDLQEAVNAGSNVLGRVPAEDNMQPIFESYLQMITEKPRYRQVVVSEVLHSLHRPTSRAQEIVGVGAPAVDEEGLYSIIEDSLKKGITRLTVKDPEHRDVKWEGTAHELRKTLKATQLNILWGKIRDYGPFGVIAFLVQLFKGVTSIK